MTVNTSAVSVSPVSFLRSRPTHAIVLVILEIHVTVVRCRIAMRVGCRCCRRPAAVVLSCAAVNRCLVPLGHAESPCIEIVRTVSKIVHTTSASSSRRRSRAARETPYVALRRPNSTTL
mgnify:CR=1 FL=1